MLHHSPTMNPVFLKADVESTFQMIPQHALPADDICEPVWLHNIYVRSFRQEQLYP